MNTKIYPDWVQEHKTKGTAIKKVGANYYLYKHTSKRVPGKKYPQPVDTYLGVITPDGIIKSGKKKLSITSLEVKEYGFSKAIWELCPQGWKDPLGADWEDILAIIILKWSSNSYISKEYTIKKEEEFHCQFAAQIGSLSRRIYKEHGVTIDGIRKSRQKSRQIIYKEHGVTIDELRKLDTIYLIYLDKENVVSRINNEQEKLLHTIAVNLEVC